MKELEKLLHSDVSEDRHYRNELKYVCSEGELQLILARIRHICPSDSHASATGTYSIRSIYFDDAQNRCFLENENGTDPREKFRIRIYNASDRRITLECKRKEHTMTNKVSCPLTKDQLTMILNGSLPESAVDSDLLRKLFLTYLPDLEKQAGWKLTSVSDRYTNEPEGEQPAMDYEFRIYERQNG